jgi:hypothetical protein
MAVDRMGAVTKRVTGGIPGIGGAAVRDVACCFARNNK